MRLIDADALLEKVWDADTRVGYVQVVDRGDIEAAPTIDPVKHGRWIPGREISKTYIGDCCVGIDYEDWRCSECGDVYQQPDKPKWKHCPNCGAKMDEGEE